MFRVYRRFMSTSLNPPQFTQDNLARVSAYDSRLVNRLVYQKSIPIRDMIATAFKLSKHIREMRKQLDQTKQCQEAYDRLIARGFNVEVLPAENLVKLNKYTKIGRSKIGVNIEFQETALELRKSPMQRKTLYFHQLKDFDKHVKVEMKKRGAPEIFEMVEREIAMDQVLDQKNPLGKPEAEPLTISVKLKKKKKCLDLKYQYHLGSIKLKDISQVYPEGQPSLVKIRNIADMPVQLQILLNKIIQDRVATASVFDDCHNLSFFLWWLRMIDYYSHWHSELSQVIISLRDNYPF